MRLLASPNQIVSGVVLSPDKAKPESEQIKWKCRVLTTAQRVAYRESLDKAYAMRDGPERDKAINDVIRLCATDWENVVGEDDKPLTFSDESLNLLSPEMRIKIAHELPEAAGWEDVYASKKP